MPRTRTRVRNRTRPHDPDYPPARVAQIRRDLRKKLAKFGVWQRDTPRGDGRNIEAAATEQKAPGLATRGSAYSADESPEGLED